MTPCYLCNDQSAPTEPIWSATTPILERPMCLACRVLHKDRFNQGFYTRTKEAAEINIVTWRLSNATHMSEV